MRAGQPVMVERGCEQVVTETGDVLARGDPGDWAGEYVVEHECRDAQLCEAAAQRFFDNAVDAATNEHGAALDVDGADREREEHDGDDEPWRSFAGRLFRDAKGI